MFGQLAGMAGNLWSMRHQVGELAVRFQKLQAELEAQRFSAISGPVRVEMNGLLQMTGCEIRSGYTEDEIARCVVDATNEALREAQAAAGRSTQAVMGDMSMLQGLLGGKP